MFRAKFSILKRCLFRIRGLRILTKKCKSIKNYLDWIHAYRWKFWAYFLIDFRRRKSLVSLFSFFNKLSALLLTLCPILCHICSRLNQLFLSQVWMHFVQFSFLLTSRTSIYYDTKMIISTWYSKWYLSELKMILKWY